MPKESSRDGYIIPLNCTASQTDKVFKTLCYLKKEAYADSCNLDDPESVKGFIANKKCSNGYKESLIETYEHYTQANSIKWNKPFYERYDKLPKIGNFAKNKLIRIYCRF